MHTTLRNLKAKDCPVLERLLSRISAFEKEDQALAMDLIHEALGHPNQKDYLFLVAVGEDDFPVGYACFGPTPLTDGTFDLYWIAVDPACAGQRVARRESPLPAGSVPAGPRAAREWLAA